MFEKHNSKLDSYKNISALQNQSYIAKFQSIKRNYIAVAEIFNNKVDSKDESEIEVWKTKVLQSWLELTEFLANDWGYDVKVFREMCRLKKANLFDANIKFVARSEKSSSLYGMGLSSDDIDFFELYAPKNQVATKSKSIWQRFFDYFSQMTLRVEKKTLDYH